MNSVLFSSILVVLASRYLALEMARVFRMQVIACLWPDSNDVELLVLFLLGALQLSARLE